MTVGSRRESGVLLHVTSLPGGRLGDAAYRFVDWLEAAGQTWWQILPLGPPDESGSPYRASSAFAGWCGLLADPDAQVSSSELESFVARHPYWIGGWAAFSGDGAVADQVRFEREWTALRAYAAEHGVRLLGDVPIYVAPNGADHTSQPELFQTGLVSGVPPDDWSATGQLWGNPLYDWDAMRATGYRWWIERFRRTFELVDVTRIDHFRAFVAYWAVPARNRTARAGSWRRAPGREVFDATRRALGRLPLVAEDLGVITEPVERLRDDLRLPGMVVLQFAFTADMKNPQSVAGERRDRVIYTGTHDNPTTVQWWEEASELERDSARLAFAAVGVDRLDPHWAMIELALRSPCYLSIFPAQDLLGLGAAARMNTPGQEAGNWTWQLEPDALTAELAERLLSATRAAGRA
ncbi:MAG: 4-alpha-glucanotransferase [Solirubrobacteraceae bacterium]|jgi:4-alpha-glucanotransferase|nr:4-alpha-glucanotransferase [Solirubrobacteraceae bacterium]